MTGRPGLGRAEWTRFALGFHAVEMKDTALKLFRHLADINTMRQIRHLDTCEASRYLLRPHATEPGPVREIRCKEILLSHYSPSHRRFTPGRATW